MDYFFDSFLIQKQLKKISFYPVGRRGAIFTQPDHNFISNLRTSKLDLVLDF